LKSFGGISQLPAVPPKGEMIIDGERLVGETLFPTPCNISMGILYALKDCKQPLKYVGKLYIPIICFETE